MSRQQLIESINQGALKTDLPVIAVGDTVSVHFRIVEGDKERVQVFTGTVISRKGRGINEMMVVRKIVDDVGVERIFPVHSPSVAKYQIVRRGDARRAKLYYLRERQGKSRRLRDRRRGLEKLAAPAVETAPEPKPVAAEASA